MATAWRGHALPDMPTEAGGHGTRKSGSDKAQVLIVRAANTSFRRHFRMSTGQCANRTTRSATEPMRNRLMPVRPCEGITTSSA
jgi:hypothetical protein